ncbi:hypothetical protein S7711_01486 [Stachybotrys chartarum IBT 7711]|uniref:Knr4/Smi1-like domain-containing protein n=1 Tax=Stachybotrys chartarum (strain CBS 109288 / IBT 7711) TaxID=1280523 RepID=A0A084B744_STACB|nr:hypothetical protein S7711_01486 [Stachybotrys chartarum IBT 7711]
MANSFGSAFRAFWHTMTSNDRHSSFDSPHRTGRHVPLNSGRNGVFTGVATASDSRADITSPFTDESGRASPNGMSPPPALSPFIPNSPRHEPYSPGLRSVAANNSSQPDGFEIQSPGDVQMQSFQDGLPPPPPVSHSWKRIDTWAEDNYPELFDQLCDGATANDLNDLEHQLDCSLPQDVRQSLMVHDGQERGGTPTGIIFGSMLLDCEEIVQEWDTWRRVNHQFLLDAPVAKPSAPSRAFGGSSSEASSSRQRPSSSSSSNPGEWRQNLLAKQDSVPPHAIQRAYAHPAWIPLVRDWGGNNLAVDLAPGPKGQWGQVIMFGRDYDTKYVVARSWGAFLAVVADDLNSGKWYVDEDNNELKLREFKDTRVEPSYFNILRWRMDQKYGRKAAQRKSMAPSKPVSPIGSRSASPYTEPSGDIRGRSLQRPNGSSPLVSPMRPPYGRVLPLGMVTEETPIPPELASANIEPTKLVEVESPRVSEDNKAAPSTTTTVTTMAPSQTDLLPHKGDEPPKLNGKQPEVIEDGAMKTIEI